MSKSTPLNQLRQGNVSNQDVVNNILTEIQNQQPPVVATPTHKQPSMELPPMNPVVQPQQNNSPVINIVPEPEPQETTVQKLLRVLKDPLVVGAIILIVSLSQVRGVLYRLIPERMPFLRYREMTLLVLQALLGVGLKYVLNTHVLDE